MTGKVTLVGAGPGDPGLMTLRGRQTLEEAEVVLYDRLVSGRVLEMIPPEAECIDVGKHSGNHPVPQEEINRLLLERAGEGKRVVRLKGGDPYLFGRGAEELERLQKAGIPFEVVPGVPSALAVPAYGGIPVTHRDYCSSVHIITGHGKEDRLSAIPYGQLASLGGTLVFMMSLSSLSEICAGLLDAGMVPDTPAALIENGTLPTQRKLVGTLANMPRMAREASFRPPAVFVVGSVCGLSGELDWFTRRPLHGVTVLNARPRKSASRLSEKLEELGCEVIEYPCIHLQKLPAGEEEERAFADLGIYGWVVFTSAFGVQVFCERLAQRGKDLRALHGIKLAAIGPGTAGELKKHGLLADLVPGVYDAQHLTGALLQAAKPGERILIYRAQKGTQMLPDALRATGFAVDDLPVYETLGVSSLSPQISERLKAGEVDLIAFGSASAVDGFAESTKDKGIDHGSLKALCIGPQSARRARELGFIVEVSADATVDSMVERILELYAPRAGTDDGSRTRP